jgi:glycyl-tRNA synthetase beta chain
VRNILAKSDVAAGEIAIEEGALIEKAEQDLARALIAARKETLPLMIARDYTAVLVRLASLRTTVDTFFDNVMVNSPHDHIRRNRHALLKELQSLFSAVADISQLPG